MTEIIPAPNSTDNTPAESISPLAIIAAILSGGALATAGQAAGDGIDDAIAAADIVNSVNNFDWNAVQFNAVKYLVLALVVIILIAIMVVSVKAFIEK